MYSATLFLHSWLRWVVLALAVIAIVRAIAGRSSGRAFTAADLASGRWYAIALDIQVTIGLILYFGFSSLLSMAMEDPGRAMATPTLRFWLVEHLVGMLAAVALAHIGLARVRKAANDAAKWKAAVTFYSLSLLAMLLSLPWPGLAHARPLFRF